MSISSLVGSPIASPGLAAIQSQIQQQPPAKIGPQTTSSTQSTSSTSEDADGDDDGTTAAQASSQSNGNSLDVNG
jgi:hypothetical protein